jgi:hypothetical protein
MPDFGEMADKAKDFAGEHDKQSDEALDKAADFAGDKTGNKRKGTQQGRRPAGSLLYPGVVRDGEGTPGVRHRGHGRPAWLGGNLYRRARHALPRRA